MAGLSFSFRSSKGSAHVRMRKLLPTIDRSVQYMYVLQVDLRVAWASASFSAARSSHHVTR